MGCFRDRDTPNRALTDQIVNSRDPGSTVFMEPNLEKHWGNFAAFLSNFICLYVIFGLYGLCFKIVLFVLKELKTFLSTKQVDIQ